MSRGIPHRETPDFEVLSLDEQFDWLYYTYRNQVFVRLLSLTHNRETAEDLLQETYIRVWRYLPTLKNTKNLFGWLFLIATNLARDENRRVVTRHLHTAGSIDHMLQEMPGFDLRGPQEDFTESIAKRELIGQTFASMNDEHKQALSRWLNCEPVDMKRVYAAKRGYKDRYGRIARRDAS